MIKVVFTCPLLFSREDMLKAVVDILLFVNNLSIDLFRPL